MIWILISLLLIVIFYLVYVLYDITKINQQLVYLQTIHSNQEVTTQSQNFLSVRLAQSINILLREKKNARIQLKENLNQTDHAIHNIAHDLRTPLTVANGYGQYLLQNDITQEEEKDYLKKLIHQLNVTEARLERLLEYSRVKDLDVEEISIQKIDISQMLKEMILNLYQSFENHGFEVIIDIESEIYLYTDQLILERLFQNLLGNILMHGEKLVKITLRKQDKIYLEIKNKTNQIIHHPERLTERFYTEDFSRKNQNAGLGLYLVSEFCHLTNGKLSIQYDQPFFAIFIYWDVLNQP